MTKSTITRERLQEIAEDGFLKHGESKELARMALAAMDSGPVENHIGSKNALEAIVSFIKSKSNPTVKCYEGVSEQLFKDNCHGIHSHVIEYILKLGEELEDLRAEQAEMQPAPVLPDEIYARTAFEAWYKTKYAFQGYEFEITDSGTYVWDNVNHMWNGYRAAMLAAAPQSPGSEPATVPGKWITVSERMPEDRTQVILWDAEIGEVTSGRYSHKTQTFYHCGDAIENEITHWMPTPAAPQEVKP